MMITRARYERLRRGWTQTKVAKLVGVHQIDISDVERGVYSRVAHRLARLYGVRPSSLYEMVAVPDNLKGDIRLWRRAGYVDRDEEKEEVS